jgi:nitrite reductase/ring-hydroxylating ferredoxin subunit
MADVAPPSSQLIYLCDTADVVEGEGLRIEDSELAEPIAVFCSDGRYFALSDTCSHAEASLSEGFIENCQVECPLRFARFDLASGRACSLPALLGVRSYRLWIVDGRVYTRLGD